MSGPGSIFEPVEGQILVIEQRTPGAVILTGDRTTTEVAGDRQLAVNIVERCSPLTGVPDAFPARGTSQTERTALIPILAADACRCALILSPHDTIIPYRGI